MFVFHYRLIVLFIEFFFLKITKIKAELKRNYRITQKFGLTHFNAKNKYNLFGRNLPVSIIML